MVATHFFDLDGTLTDPAPGITRCIQYAHEGLGLDVPDAEDLLWCIGPPLQESFQHLVGADHAAEALRLYRERYSEIGLFENAVYPGVTELLGALRSRGAALHVASSKPRVFVERILDHFALTPCFDQVFGSELDGSRTNKSELLAHALERTGASGPGATMVGDRSHDAVGAKANGMRFVGVLYGYGSREELTGAAGLAETPLALRELL